MLCMEAVFRFNVTFALLVYVLPYIVTSTSYKPYINYTDLIRLLKVAIILFFFYFISQLFLTCRCARHGVTAYVQLRL